MVLQGSFFCPGVSVKLKDWLDPTYLASVPVQMEGTSTVLPAKGPDPKPNQIHEECSYSLFINRPKLWKLALTSTDVKIY